MARLRKVSEEQALDAALATFWQHGYGALGTRQLETETGITRFTLQTSYGGKMALFGRALDRYLDRMEAEMIPAMANGTLDGLARWFEMRCDSAAMGDGPQWGCMMIAAMNEFGATEADITDRSERFQRMLRDGFRKALEQIQQDGGLDSSTDVPSAIEMLVAASIGLNVIVRAHGACAAGQDMAAGIARMIRGWGPSPE